MPKRNRAHPAGYRPRPPIPLANRLVVGWIVGGCAGIAAVFMTLGGSPGPSLPAAPARTVVQPWSQVCIGTVPQVCSMSGQAAR